MKKISLIIILTMTMAVSLMGCGSEKEKSNQESTKKEEIVKSNEQNEESEVKEESEDNNSKIQETKVEQINLENSEGSLVYERHEITTNYNGENAIRIYFTYTNKSDTANSAQVTFYPQVFQNGIECEFTIGNFEEDNEAENNLSKQLMKDTSLEVAFLYALQDIENPVILKVTDHSSENILNNIYQEQELVLNK